MFDDKTPSELWDLAAEALRQARRLPIGEARNEKRQIAVCLKFLASRRQTLWASEPKPDDEDTATCRP